MKPDQINDLLEKYNSGSATQKEKALVEAWYAVYQNPDANLPAAQLETDQKESLDKLLHEIQGKPKTISWQRWAVAAAMLVFITGGVYFWPLIKKPEQQVAFHKPLRHDLAPGGNKAILTLGNGMAIVLNGAKNGKLANQGGVIVNKTADGKISYTNAKGDASSSAIIYNTAATPRGGQYQFTLADGTKVWLNAASSIRYPVDFKGSERRVELTGEAYFEVAHNSKMPFRVVSNGQTVEVLGTHFDINAYDDEGTVKTTLLEGSVKVSSAKRSTVIKPGEQARLKNGEFMIANVNLDEAVAWKNGFFYFEDSDIREVMRQLSRWYDVEVKYEFNVPSRVFSGEISRNINASQILDILSFKKIHFTIEDKAIIIKQ